MSMTEFKQNVDQFGNTIILETSVSTPPQNGVFQ